MPIVPEPALDTGTAPAAWAGAGARSSSASGTIVHRQNSPITMKLFRQP